MSSPSDFVLGMDFGGSSVALATADLAGAVIERRNVPVLAERGAELVLERALTAAHELIERTRSERGGALARVGVASMGVTRDDRVDLAPLVPNWKQLALPAAMNRAFGVEVRIENDVKAAARAELRWGVLRDSSTAIYVNLGTGISVALIIERRVVRGGHEAAGEIAYSARHPNDEIGIRLGHAPLEEFVGGRSFEEQASLLFGASGTTGDLFRAAETDPDLRSFVEARIGEIAFHVANLAVVVDPERVVLGGGMMRSVDHVLPRVRLQLVRFVPFPPLVVPAHFDVDSALMGALALVVDEGSY